jgi:hypothetical protein
MSNTCEGSMLKAEMKTQLREQDVKRMRAFIPEINARMAFAMATNGGYPICAECGSNVGFARVGGMFCLRNIEHRGIVRNGTRDAVSAGRPEEV